MSLVDVSVSTLSALNVTSHTRRSMASSRSGAISASVVITEIIVAMSGSIIPDPFAMPTTLAVPLPAATVAQAVFGCVSVVMIAVAADVASQCQAPRSASDALSPASSLPCCAKEAGGGAPAGNAARRSKYASTLPSG